MARAFIAAGSNIDPEKNVRYALRLLGERVTIRQVSTVFLTEPIGPAGQQPYYNCVIDAQTDLAPSDLKQNVLRTIEKELGRTRTADKYAPRTIDLDLLLYDDAVIASDAMVLPDPDIAERPFLAAMLRELEPDLAMPGTGMKISDIAQRLSPGAMKPLERYTKRLRKEVLHEREP